LLKKNKNQLTVDEFLQYVPKRLDFEWYTDEDGIVHIRVPKFKSKIGEQFCRLIHKENIFIANLDKKGSLVWKNCDGKKTVKQILDILKKEFPDEKDIDQRLFLFLHNMKNLNYIDY